MPAATDKRQRRNGISGAGCVASTHAVPVANDDARSPIPSRCGGIERGDASPSEEKKFAQICAIGLVRREIGHPFGKFFLAAVQAFRAGDRARRTRAASWRRAAKRAASMKKKRVLPMFFFKHMSVGCAGAFRTRRDVAVAGACRYRPPAPGARKKLREGVDTQKNRD
jgi:hypothetical protein